jgi:hypothetical protein
MLNGIFFLLDRYLKILLLNGHFSDIGFVDHFDQLLNLFKVHAFQFLKFWVE